MAFGKTVLFSRFGKKQNKEEIAFPECTGIVFALKANLEWRCLATGNSQHEMCPDLLKSWCYLQVNFGCILNDTEVTRYVNMTNTSPQEVSYRWYFQLEHGVPVTVHHNVSSPTSTPEVSSAANTLQQQAPGDTHMMKQAQKERSYMALHVKLGKRAEAEMANRGLHQSSDKRKRHLIRREQVFELHTDLRTVMSDTLKLSAQKL